MAFLFWLNIILYIVLCVCAFGKAWWMHTFYDSSHVCHIIRKAVEHSRRSMRGEAMTRQIYSQTPPIWEKHKERQRKAWVGGHTDKEYHTETRFLPVYLFRFVCVAQFIMKLLNSGKMKCLTQASKHLHTEICWLSWDCISGTYMLIVSVIIGLCDTDFAEGCNMQMTI